MSKNIDITLVGCAGLMGKHDSGFSDPVVHLNCSGRVQISSVKQGTNSPLWNESFCWTLPSGSHGVPLTLHVWNSPKFELGPDTKGAFLGTATLDNVLTAAGTTKTLILQKRSSRSNVSGSITIRVDDDSSKLSVAENKAAPAAAHPYTSSLNSALGHAGGARSPPSSLSSADAQLLDEFTASEGNKQCADCDSQQPSWASVNNGVLICTACSGVHRSLGVQHSFVQSLKLDSWTSETVHQLVESPGTAAVNLQLEFHVPAAYAKPTTRSAREVREAFISAK
jgi:hypothetical protein